LAGFAAVSGIWEKIRPAAGGAAGAPTSDIDYRLLVPLAVNVAIIQAVYAVERITTSYRAIELALPVVWLGIISATFAILPIIFAVQVGRYLDRGKDAQAVWIGTVLLVIACAGFRFAADSLVMLLVLTALLGISHILIMASQQMLCVRCSGPRGRDAIFGNYVIASAVGQGVGPYFVAWAGGSATLPPTDRLFAIGLIVSFASAATAIFIRPAPAHLLAQAKSKDVLPLRTLLRQRGLMAYLVASVITMAAQDLVTIYLPLLGAEKNIDARNIGSLLTVRSVAALISRMGYVRIISLMGRRPLTLASMVASGIGFACLALPIQLPAMFAAMTLTGFALGIATTLSLTNVVDLAAPTAIGTVMSLRNTGNRVGQMAVPFVASLIAAATGVGGIFMIVALTLVGSGVAVHFSGEER
jgi:predicted MFS family arabinose efflux permease